jgi:hypothetical protein
LPLASFPICSRVALMSKLVAIGLPETGKTTFLAALWHVAESEEVPGSLRLQKISDEAKHLNNIRSEWLSFRPVTRTIPGQEQPVSFWFRNEQNDIGELAFPDLSGEEFKEAWKGRHWPKSYDDSIADATALLLFIHPDTVKEPISISDLQKLAEVVLPKEAEADANAAILRDSDKIIDPAEWDAEKAPTQVQLVEVLQFVQLRSKVEFPIRVAVIVSAWDIVMARYREKYAGESGAEGWLKDRLPYLDQFLRANPEFLVVRTYGVSAQGGDLQTDRVALQRFENASERILIHGPDCKPHDISEPVRWCLGLR